MNDKYENLKLNHLILFGDSIFDNGVYVNPGQSNVTSHLERKLEPLGWSVEIRAVDGHVVN